MKTAAASATDMVKRLAEKGMLNYVRYKGFSLTKLGSEYATTLIRKHRIWETFLVNKLDYKWDEVHELAEQLEHVRSVDLVDRLDAFLDFPKYDPHGDPIPNADGKYKLRASVQLTNLRKGMKAAVVSVKKDSKSLLNFLDDVGISIGTELIYMDKIEFDESVKLNIRGQNIVISKQVADCILVKL